MGALQLLNTMNVKVRVGKTPREGAHVCRYAHQWKDYIGHDRHQSRNNFISEIDLQCLGLMLEKDSSKMKAIDSKVRLVVGKAKGVELEVS